MKKLFIFISAIFLSLALSAAYALEASPLGYWQTIDDVTGKPKAIIQIKRTANNELVGRILKIYPRPGSDQNMLCTACEGDKRNQRIVGMVILNKLKPNKDSQTEWVDGEILDPKNGKTYHSNLKVIADGHKLAVRGYIGFPMFGRSQTWIRVANLADTA